MSKNQEPINIDSMATFEEDCSMELATGQTSLEATIVVYLRSALSPWSVIVRIDSTTHYRTKFTCNRPDICPAEQEQYDIAEEAARTFLADRK
jgi:hypothetical protein